MAACRAHDRFPSTGATRSGAPGHPRSAPVALRALVASLALALSAVGATAGTTETPKPARAGASPAPNAVIWRTTVEPVWPAPSALPSLSKLGERVAVVFSPDFSVPTNRVFYERMGFLYIEDA